MVKAMILTRADGTGMFMGFGWIVEDPLPMRLQERASQYLWGVTRHVRQNLEEVMDRIVVNAHREAMTARKTEPETYNEFLDRVVRGRIDPGERG
jgi:hypothetical protein